jgi:hypothetical protein
MPEFPENQPEVQLLRTGGTWDVVPPTPTGEYEWPVMLSDEQALERAKALYGLINSTELRTIRWQVEPEGSSISLW